MFLYLFFQSELDFLFIFYTIRSMKKQLNLDFDVKYSTVQVYRNSHNFQFNHWIKLKFYVKSPNMLSYLGLQCQVNRSSERHGNTSQQRLYEFYY
jgi:hypothetical protein